MKSMEEERFIQLLPRVGSMESLLSIPCPPSPSSESSSSFVMDDDNLSMLLLLLHDDDDDIDLLNCVVDNGLTNEDTAAIKITTKYRKISRLADDIIVVIID